MLGPLAPSPLKKTRSFPPWFEAALVVLFIIMAVIEYNNDQLFWAAIFCMAGTFLGISLGISLFSGDKRDPS